VRCVIHDKNAAGLFSDRFLGNSSLGGTGVTGAAGGSGGTAAPLFGLGAANPEIGGERNRNYPTVLSAEISESHYDEAVESIKMNKGHIDA
jgi:hypothetical protein